MQCELDSRKHVKHNETWLKWLKNTWEYDPCFFDTLVPGQNGRNFADVNLKCILNENVRNSIKIQWSSIKSAISHHRGSALGARNPRVTDRFPYKGLIMRKWCSLWHSKIAILIFNDARAVMHVGIGNPRWRGNRNRHSPRMHNPQFYEAGKRPIDLSPTKWYFLRHFWQTN